MMPPKRERSKKDIESGDDSDEYRKKRDRNNLAVKRSRVKSKQKTQETMSRVNQLKQENSVLEEKVKSLTQELGFLKELFLAHASNSANQSKFEGFLQRERVKVNQWTTSKCSYFHHSRG